MKQQLTDDQLKSTAKSGEGHAAKALSVLAKREVSVSTKEAKIVDSDFAQTVFDKIKTHAVIAYTQALTGISGVSLLSLERKDALNLVDLFNNRPAGTTVVMQELDRSTIRETLNILANSYVTELAKAIDTTVVLSVPNMITSGRLDDISGKINISQGEKSVLFDTELAVAGVGFKIRLYFFFIAEAENNKEALNTEESEVAAEQTHDVPDSA